MKTEMFTALFTSSAPPFKITSLIQAVRAMSYYFSDIDFIIVIPSTLGSYKIVSFPHVAPQIRLFITLTLLHARPPLLNPYRTNVENRVSS